MEVVLAGYRMALVIVLAGPFLTLLARMGVETTPSTISGTVGSFQSGGAFAGQRVLTIERLLMSGCGQVHYPQENVSKKIWLKFPMQAPSRSGNTDQRKYP